MINSLTETQLQKKYYWIRQAIYNENSPDFYYGHELDLGFDSFQEFADYVSKLPQPTPQHRYLHRKNQHVGWVRNNLVLATGKQAGNNRRSAKKIRYKGLTLSHKEWADRIGIDYSTFHYRLHRGMTIRQIIQTPNKRTGETYALA